MAHFTDDIPEAQRETLVARTEPSLAKSSSKVIVWLLLSGVGLGLASLGIWWVSRVSQPLGDGSTPAEPTSVTTSSGGGTAPADRGESGAIAPPPTDTSTNTSTNTSTDIRADSSADPDTRGSGPANSLLGHRPYAIADVSSLVSISTNPTVKLKPEVAQTVETMMAEARAIGISLDVISGFRSLDDQQYLFFDLKAERGQTTQTRAEVSAPPGYSEHHTGYAVDFIDSTRPDTDLNASFEETQAFRWLEQNAPYYGFEMSFPRNNEQNVAYEPWHWRYVGNQESLELFYQEPE